MGVCWVGKNVADCIFVHAVFSLYENKVTYMCTDFMKNSIDFTNLRRHWKRRVDICWLVFFFFDCFFFVFDHQIRAAYEENVLNSQSSSFTLHPLGINIWSAVMWRLTFTYLIRFAKNSKLIGPQSTKD